MDMLIRLFPIALVLPFTADAQISVVSTVPYKLSAMINLSAAGPKFISTNATGFTLYNTDLTVFLAVTPPPAPIGYNYLSLFTPIYLTESLFDTDPSTIEYIAVMQNTNNPSQPGVRVYRTDGTVLLEDLTHGMSGWNGQDDLNSSSFIMDTPLGTRMTLSTGGFYPPQETVVYALPGTLPCLPCDGSGVINGWNDEHAPVLELLAYPNPTGHNATIHYELPPDEGKAELVFLSINGDVVKRMGVDRSGLLTVTTADMAPGTYLYQLETAKGRIGPERMIVLR